jgi:S1-C subfamily serine protease
MKHSTMYARMTTDFPGDLVRAAFVASATLLAAAAFAAPVQAQTPVLGIDSDMRTSQRGWAVGYSNWAVGCVASGTYSGGVTLWLGSGARFGSFVAFTNADWQSIVPGRGYRMEVKTRGYGNWNGEFLGFDRGREKGVISTKLKTEFLTDFARSAGFTVLLEGRQIANISLSGSRVALNEVISCYNANRARIEAAANAASSATKKPAPAAAPSKPTAKTGTGFFVSTDGHVLTNQHVVEGCSVFQVSRVGALAEQAKLLAVDKENDLALLKTGIKQDPIPGFRNRVRVGETVAIYGFPLTGLLATTGNFTVGNVTATAGLRDDTRKYQISAPIHGGNSGGPLMDRSGNIIGVIVSSLNPMYLMEAAKDIPQNVNFAIKAPIATNFLESNGVSPKEVAEGPAIDQAEIAAKAKDFTVRIRCSSQ